MSTGRDVRDDRTPRLHLARPARGNLETVPSLANGELDNIVRLDPELPAPAMPADYGRVNEKWLTGKQIVSTGPTLNHVGKSHGQMGHYAVASKKSIESFGDNERQAKQELRRSGYFGKCQPTTAGPAAYAKGHRPR